MENKKILITGGSGSIGSALVRTIAKQKPKKLIILDQDETGAFDLYQELEKICNVDYVIANIRERITIEDIFKKQKPDIVFHAAALKHVSPMERYPLEALSTNVIGTWHVINASLKNNVKKFVFISSDKAVNPKCFMGFTKYVGERLCKNANKEGKTKFIVVRFGNVMASRGSLIPIWNKQIQEGKNLTVTHKNMERFFMGIYEAVDLVLKAARLGKGGETFVLDMGKPINIPDLAKLMIRLSGKPLSIDYMGVRPGEKYNEELMTKEERSKAIKKGGLFIIK